MPKLTKSTKPRAVKATTVAVNPAVHSLAPVAVLTLPNLMGVWYGLGLALSFFVPSVGLGLAVLYAPQSDRQARHFGRYCLLLALLGGFVAWVTGAVQGALGDGEWFIQPYE